MIDLVKGEALADVSDVVALRVSGFSQFIGGGAQYSRTNRYFLKTDGTVLLQDLVEYISPPPVPAPTLTTTLFAAGVKDVTSAGFVRSADGQVLYNGLVKACSSPTAQAASSPPTSPTCGARRQCDADRGPRCGDTSDVVDWLRLGIGVTLVGARGVVPVRPSEKESST